MDPQELIFLKNLDPLPSHFRVGPNISKKLFRAERILQGSKWEGFKQGCLATSYTVGQWFVRKTSTFCRNNQSSCIDHKKF